MASRTRSKPKSIGRWKVIFSNDVHNNNETAPSSKPPDSSSTPPSAQLKSKSRRSEMKKKSLDGGSKSKEEVKENEKVKSDNERSIEERKEKKEEGEASIFEEVKGPAQPAQAQTHGVKNKMRWKIDVEPVDVNGSQKIEEICEKAKKLRRRARQKSKNKFKGTNKSGDLSQEDEINVEDIFLCAKILQLIKMQKLIEKELKESEQEVLKNYCRSGSDEDKAEPIIDKLSLVILSSIVSKNDNCRVPTVPGQLRMYAVDEKTAKFPMIALMIVRKDMLYVSWSKSGEIGDATSDPTWSSMTAKRN